ncbi:MAG: cytosine permease [Clostridiales bacterium]|nr:cytosine permease [Clostridiales bacterium]
MAENEQKLAGGADGQKLANVEQKALSRIPDAMRQSWTSVAFIWIGTMICIPMLMVGGILAGMMTLGGIILAAALGFAICAAVMFLGGMQGTDLGLPSTMCATKAFGDRGSSFISSLVVFIAQLGWFGVQTAVCATAFTALMGFVGFPNFPFWASCVIWGIVMLFTAVFGFKFMKVLNYIAVPALLIMCIYGIAYSANTGGWEALSGFTPEFTMPMAAAVSLIIGLFAVGTVINADFTRYSKSRRNTGFSTFLGVVPAAVFMIFAGSVMARGTGEYDISMIFASIGVPVLGMLVLILATWTTNTANAYTAALACMKLFSLKDARRPLVTVICGAIGIIIAIAGLADALTVFITILGSFVPPIAGAVMADYWIVGRGKPANWRPVKGINGCGVIAWAVGGVLALLFGSTIPGQPLAAVGNFFSPALAGILIACGLYVLLYKIAGKSALGGQGEISLEEVEERLK